MTPAPQDDSVSAGSSDPGARPSDAPTGPLSDLLAHDSSSSLTSAMLDVRASASIRRYAPGEVLDERYTIVEEIGAGGMGVVYKAVDRLLDQPVALKLLQPSTRNDAGVARFRRELALAQRVSHPNVCRLHDLGDVQGVLYISMQHVQGQRLDHLILAMGHLSPKQTIALGRQLCAGLAAIHEQGIVHRDLKPSNLMVDRSGHVYIMDFGLAVRPGGEERVTASGAVLGTLAYLSPEQARGNTAAPASDVYALGLILFEMLTGRCPPGDASSLPLALREASETCPPPSTLEPDVPPSLDEVVMGCLERDVTRRFASASAVAQRLERAQVDLSTSSAGRRAITAVTAAPSPVPTATKPRLPRWAVGVLAAAVVFAVALGLGRTRRHAALLPATGGKPVGLAVMPLRFTGSDDHAYLKDLLPLILTERMAAIGELDAAPFSSTRTMGAVEDVKTVGQQLGVAAALYGDLNEKGDQLELSLRLLRADTRQVMWTKTVRGTANDIIARSEEAAPEVTSALGVTPKSEDRRSIGKRDPGALALYAKGRTLLEGWDVETNAQQAAEAFARALSLDDGFAEAHAARAIALWRQYELMHDTVLVDRAHAEAQRAIALQPTIPEAQIAMGTIDLGMGRSAEASAAFEKAQSLAPGDDGVCRDIARAYASLGRRDEAEAVLGRAIALRPNNWQNYHAKADFLTKLGRLEEAKAFDRKVIELRPENSIGYSHLGGLYILSGNPEAAEPYLKAALKLQPSAHVHSNLGFVYYAAGRFEDAAREFAAAANSEPEAGYFGNLGDAYRRLGRTADAQAAYENAITRAETRLRINPSDIEYEAALAMWLAGAGRCPEALRQVRQAADRSRTDPQVDYYSAVAAALCHNGTLALQYARRAASEGGLADIKTNADLAPVLRASPAGRELLGAGPGS